MPRSGTWWPRTTCRGARTRTSPRPSGATGERSAPGPLLVGRRRAGPQQGQRAVGGLVVGDVQTQAGLVGADRAVALEGPLLVGAAVAVPDLHLRPGGGPGRGVQALAQRLQGLTRDSPLLVGGASAVPDHRLGAVCRVAVRHVQAAA